MLKLKVAFFLSVLTLAACSGGKSGSTNDSKPDEPRTEIEVKYNLPPAPDAELAKTEIVDTNNDGLRDEVERGIALSLDEEGEDVVGIAKEIAKLDQLSMQDSQTQNIIVKSYKKKGVFIGCLMQKYQGNGLKVQEILRSIKPLMLDTDARKNQYDQTEETLSGGSFPMASMNELKQNCPQYFQ